MTEMDALKGAQMAMTAVVKAMLLAHPNPSAVQQLLATHAELLRAQLLAASGSDESIRACDTALKAWEQLLADPQSDTSSG